MAAKRTISFSAALLLLCSLALRAGAAQPACESALKGSVAAESTRLDASAYADADAYENPAPSVGTVRIGLRYGESAVAYAEFENSGGAGFIIGKYDAARSFTELARTDASDLVVSVSSGGGAWHILLDARYGTQSEAQNAASAYGGSVQTVDGEYRVLYGAYDSREAAEAVRDRFGLPGSSYTAEKGGIRVVSGLDSSAVYSAAAEESAIALVPVSDGAGLTEYRGNFYRGGFECAVFDSTRLNVINCVALEDYVKGVIPYEMSYDWPFEALKAQAICARTYVVYNQEHYPDYGFDLTDNTESQVYRGTGEANATTDAAVDETAGQLVRYRGEICEVYYFASDGGATEDGLNVFDTDRAYLAGVIDPFEQAVDYSIKNWTARRTGEELAGLLLERGYELGEVTAIELLRSATGNVVSMSFYDASGGSVRIDGRKCYTSIGLNNCRFSVEQDGENFVFSGSGWGHNCGMSQWGANAMASVYGFNCEDIIRFYFTGAYIA
ncbi:MAG: SpoIID/LytB domain-containing protein [Oscillospiraceae bacterium]|nr:SpoIID/LytB domain-containing protein [Oscillospiraceae bacterium]